MKNIHEKIEFLTIYSNQSESEEIKINSFFFFVFVTEKIRWKIKEIHRRDEGGGGGVAPPSTQRLISTSALQQRKSLLAWIAPGKNHKVMM